jgi:hypothetical protein
LLVTGRIRGQAVAFDDYLQAPVGSVKDLQDVNVETSVFDGLTGDRNTLKIAIVVIGPAAAQ